MNRAQARNGYYEDSINTAKENMESKSIPTFAELFQERMDQILSDSANHAFTYPRLITTDILGELMQQATDKRSFGLEKYGEQSMQGSFENFMVCPIQQHLIEELIDAVNYTSALVFRAQVEGNDEAKTKWNAVLKLLAALYMESL